MAIHEDLFGHKSGGLARASLNAYTSVDAKCQDERRELSSARISPNSCGATDKESSSMSIVRRLSRNIRSKVHKKPKEIFVSSNGQDKSDSTNLIPTLAPTPPEAAENDRFSGLPPEKPSLPPLKDFIKSPLQTAKTIAQAQGGNDLAENLAKTEAAHGASVRVVRAFDELAEAASEVDEELALRKLELLKKGRQDSFVRWTLDRHVNKVGRLHAHRTPRKPKTDFLVTDKGGRETMHWNDYGIHLFLFYLEQYGGQYIGASSDLPDPTEDALMASCERVLLTSAPLQNLFMRMRSIAHWENPRESFMYMVTYLVLLYYDYILRAALLLVSILVVRRRYYPPTVEDMRQDLEISEDRDAMPADLSQHIDQHGGHGWVEPLVEKAGPVMLSHLEDLADFLEILRNFYEWRDSKRTASTLVVILVSWFAISLIPLWLFVKCAFLAVGIIFLGFMPISYRYPSYRLLLSPLIWTFWKIPTHAEWAIARLQAEANHHLKTWRSRENSAATSGQVVGIVAFKESDPSPISDPVPRAYKDSPGDPPTRIGKYHCISEKHHGNLCLSTDRVSFVTHISVTERWSVPFENMQSMQKLATKGTVGAGDDILFKDMDGREFTVSALKGRDEVFSQIIGYSGVGWQRTG